MNYRKHEVILVAQRLFLERGFTATSIQDILNSSNISKGTFYNYFSSKNECLMAMLEYGRDEILIQRRELLTGENLADKSILIKQISIQFQVNYEHNLLPIFQAILHSEDPELKALIKSHHLEELSWLSHRLTDIYGLHIKPYASDCAVMIHGIMQHMLHAWKVSNKEILNVEKLVHYAMRRIDIMIPDMVRHEDHLLDVRNFFDHNQEIQDNNQTKKQLLTQLMGIRQQLDSEGMDRNHQYINFLIEEIQAEAPRFFLLETVIPSFRESFIGTHFDHRSDEIALGLWKYLDSNNKEDNK